MFVRDFEEKRLNAKGFDEFWRPKVDGLQVRLFGYGPAWRCKSLGKKRLATD